MTPRAPGKCRPEPGTPRIANRFLRRVRTLPRFCADGVIFPRGRRPSPAAAGVDQLGLTPSTGACSPPSFKTYGGGPCGPETLAANIGEEAVTWKTYTSLISCSWASLTLTPGAAARSLPTRSRASFRRANNAFVAPQNRNFGPNSASQEKMLFTIDKFIFFCYSYALGWETHFSRFFSLDRRHLAKSPFFGWSSVSKFCCVSTAQEPSPAFGRFSNDNGAVRIDPWTTDQQLLDGQLSRGYHKSPKRGNCSSMYEDKTLVCKECNEFVFTAGEQEFYAERGFQNEPQRCKACRPRGRMPPVAPWNTSPPPAPAAPVRPRIPFRAKSDRPVYCGECFQLRCAATANFPK